MTSRTLLKSTLLYMPAQLLGPLVQFVVVVTWTHLLDPATFGVVTFVVAAQELTALIGLIWWSLYVLRFRQRFLGAEADRFRAMDSRMVISGALAQAIFAPLCLLSIGVDPNIPAVLAATSYLVARLALVHYSEWARSEHRIAAYSIAQLAGPILGSGLSIVSILQFGPSPAVALSAMAAGQAVGAVGLMAALGVRLRFGVFDRSIFLDARRYGLPLVVSGLFAWAAINGVRILVQAGAGVVGVGLLSAGWGLGQRIANVIAMLCTAAAFPIAVDRIESGDRAGALDQVSLNGTLMFALLAPATAGVAVLSAPIVNLMIAADYRAVTVIVLPISVAAGALRTLKTHTADQCGLLLERTRAMMASNALDATTTLACAAIGMLVGGIPGAALGCFVGAAISAFGALIYAAVWLGLPVDMGACARIALATAAMTLALASCATPKSAVAIAAEILLGASVYFLGIGLLFPPVRAMARDRLRRFNRA